jgi:hypothetical protein
VAVCDASAVIVARETSFGLLVARRAQQSRVAGDAIVDNAF